VATANGAGKELTDCRRKSLTLRCSEAKNAPGRRGNPLGMVTDRLSARAAADGLI
jgi:hypothetical protein